MFPILKQNATIGIVAPSSPTKIERIKKGIKKLNALGYKVILGKSVNKTYLGYLSGDDDIRYQDINEMFKNPQIDGIICQNGGYGVARIIDKIDYQIIKKFPKLFCGFSDITLLLNAIYLKTGIVTLHGPMLAVDFSSDRQEIFLDSFLKLLKKETIVINKNNEYSIEVIKEGISEGILVGGNLSLLNVFINMDIGDYFKDKILLIEETKEKEYRIDRMIQSLRLKGVFNQLKGIIIGGITGDNISKEGILELFRNLFKDLNYPILFNVPIGHVTPRYTVPIGGKVEINSYNKTVTILNK